MKADDKTCCEGPLKGLRVIEAGLYIAGPFACTLLADFGADIIKIEQPKVGDPMRARPPEKDNQSLWWKMTGRNKRTITLDMGKPEGAELFKRLASTADVVLENFRPGTFEKWGIGYDVLSKINPRLVFVRISGYGQTGPYRHRPGYGTVAECFSGIPSGMGDPDRPPTMFSFPAADSVASVFAAMATMFAIYERDQGGSGIGQEVDVSLYEPLFRLAEAQVIAYDQLQYVRPRMGNRSPTDSPRNIYKTRDGRYIAISGGAQRTFNRLASAMGMPELGTDERFKDGFARQTNAGVLDDIVAAWFVQHDFDEIVDLFEKQDVVSGPVYDIRDILKDPQYAARQNIIEVLDEDFGKLRMQNAIPRFVRTPGRIRHAGKALGADNESVYAGELGIGAEELERLKSLNVI